MSQFGKQHVLQHVILDSRRVNGHVAKNELQTIDRSTNC
jgi:hypothetical protein